MQENGAAYPQWRDDNRKVRRQRPAGGARGWVRPILRRQPAIDLQVLFLTGRLENMRGVSERRIQEGCVTHPPFPSLSRLVTGREGLQSRSPGSHPTTLGIPMGNDIGNEWEGGKGVVDVHVTWLQCKPDRVPKVHNTRPPHPHAALLQGKEKQGEHAGAPLANHPLACSLHTCASSYRVPWEGLGGLWFPGTTSYLFLSFPFLALRMTCCFFGRGQYYFWTNGQGSRRRAERLCRQSRGMAPHTIELRK